MCKMCHFKLHWHILHVTLPTNLIRAQWHHGWHFIRSLGGEGEEWEERKRKERTVNHHDFFPSLVANKSHMPPHCEGHLEPCRLPKNLNKITEDASGSSCFWRQQHWLCWSISLSDHCLVSPPPQLCYPSKNRPLHKFLGQWMSNAQALEIFSSNNGSLLDFPILTSSQSIHHPFQLILTLLNPNMRFN